MPRRGSLLLLLAVATAAPLAAQSALPEWVAVDPASRTVSLTLEVRPGPDGHPTLNGFRDGGLSLDVPLGWTVRWTWVNRDSAARHSLVIMAERERIPIEGGRPGLENAMTRAVTAGLKPGERDLTTFTADQAGWYWMLCGVSGHGIAGEWIRFKVDREATEVGVRVKSER